MAPDSLPVLIYDGDCGFCTASANALARHWATSAHALPWQHLPDTELARFGLSVSDVEQAVWWIDGRGRPFRGHAAIAAALVEAGGWRALTGRLIRLPAVSLVAGISYRIVARYRHRLPGATPACRR